MLFKIRTEKADLIIVNKEGEIIDTKRTISTNLFLSRTKNEIINEHLTPKEGELYSIGMYFIENWVMWRKGQLVNFPYHFVYRVELFAEGTHIFVKTGPRVKRAYFLQEKEFQTTTLFELLRVDVIDSIKYNQMSSSSEGIPLKIHYLNEDPAYSIKLPEVCIFEN